MLCLLKERKTERRERRSPPWGHQHWQKPMSGGSQAGFCTGSPASQLCRSWLSFFMNYVQEATLFPSYNPFYSLKKTLQTNFSIPPVAKWKVPPNRVQLDWVFLYPMTPAKLVLTAVLSFSTSVLSSPNCFLFILLKGGHPREVNIPTEHMLSHTIDGFLIKICSIVQVMQHRQKCGKSVPG